MTTFDLPRQTVVVFSHLRWGFVFQRPQHLLSRLAGRWRVVFVEEPVRSDTSRLEVKNIDPHLTVVVPHTPVAAPGFHDDQLAVLEPLLGSYFARQHLVGAAVGWLYTPMALPLLKVLQPQCIVYDCMDELTAFKDAPRQLRQRESALMKSASLVLTGGPSLFQARCGQHPHLHCLPSAVDAAHFSPANLKPDSAHAHAAADLQDHLPAPRLGYYGVIDERLDLDLVDRIAQAHPHWQVVMVGPVAKIDTASLPQRPNLHWLGMQPYERLPYLLHGWDVALMPFALNEATRFISPTKTLEYMAAEKPVVSTAVHDVVALYGNAVDVADSGEDFVRTCERVLEESTARRAEREMQMMSLVWASSWRRSADCVHALLLNALERTQLPTSATPEPLRAVAGL